MLTAAQKAGLLRDDSLKGCYREGRRAEACDLYPESLDWCEQEVERWYDRGLFSLAAYGLGVCYEKQARLRGGGRSEGV